jgi:hypothetical protein
MINILEYNVPPTASISSFEGATFSSNRADNASFEKKTWSIKQSRNQSFLDYVVNILQSMSASVIRSLTNETTVRDTTFIHDIDLVFYKQVLELLSLNTVSKSSGLTQATALRKLEELKNLPEDWDAYGANPISPNAIAKAKSIITSVILAFGDIIGNVVQLTDVIPIADGGVQLEWIGPHAELEIEILPDGTIGLLYISGSEDNRIYEESENNSLSDIYAKVGRLILSQYNN